MPKMDDSKVALHSSPVVFSRRLSVVVSSTRSVFCVGSLRLDLLPCS